MTETFQEAFLKNSEKKSYKKPNAGRVNCQ